MGRVRHAANGSTPHDGRPVSREGGRDGPPAAHAGFGDRRPQHLRRRQRGRLALERELRTERGRLLRELPDRTGDRDDSPAHRLRRGDVFRILASGLPKRAMGVRGRGPLRHEHVQPRARRGGSPPPTFVLRVPAERDGTPLGHLGVRASGQRSGDLEVLPRRHGCPSRVLGEQGLSHRTVVGPLPDVAALRRDPRIDREPLDRREHGEPRPGELPRGRLPRQPHARYGDPADPAPGQAFFFLYRGSVGASAAAGSYGQGTGGKERLAGSGACNP